MPPNFLNTNDMTDTNEAPKTDSHAPLSGVTQRIVWHTFDGKNGDTSWRQHAFINTIRTVPYTGDKYIGNKTLCSRSGASEDGETYLSINEINNEEISSECCKTCLKIYNKQYGG